MHFAFPVRKKFKFLLLKNYCSFHINETNSFTDTGDTWNKTFLFNLKKEAQKINLLVAINNFYYIYILNCAQITRSTCGLNSSFLGQMFPVWTWYCRKASNRHADLQCSFYSLPLQSVKWTHTQKLQHQHGEIIYLKPGNHHVLSINLYTILIFFSPAFLKSTHHCANVENI